VPVAVGTMRNPAKKDLPGTLQKIREMGRDYVQWSGMPNLPADRIRAGLDGARWKARGRGPRCPPMKAWSGWTKIGFFGQPALVRLTKHCAPSRRTSPCG
jgi:hypothetical protein